MEEASEKGYRKDVISQIMEEAFIMPNVKEFRSVYEKNLEEHAKQIHTRTSCHFEEFPYWFIPATDGVYYLYGKISREIGGKVVASGSMYSDDEILGWENVFDATVFWKDWDYIEPIKTKQRNSKQMVYFLSDGILPFSYLQLPEFGDVFQEEWHIFGSFFRIIRDYPFQGCIRASGAMQKYFGHGLSLNTNSAVRRRAGIAGMCF